MHFWHLQLLFQGKQQSYVPCGQMQLSHHLQQLLGGQGLWLVRGRRQVLRKLRGRHQYLRVRLLQWWMVRAVGSVYLAARSFETLLFLSYPTRTDA